MKVTWSVGAARDINRMDEKSRSKVVSETEIMFADTPPFPVQKLSETTAFVELPCGVEVDFEYTPDGIRIIFVVIGGVFAMEMERNHLQSLRSAHNEGTTQRPGGLTAVHDGA